VRDAVRDDERGRVLTPEPDEGAHALGGRSAAEVSQANRGTAVWDGEVVVVPQMDVDAAEHAAVGADRVPLNRADARRPLLPVELRERAAVVDVRFERAHDDARRQRRVDHSPHRPTLLSRR
jgi:hypothetical protein